MDLAAIVDAIATDLNALALPTHKTRKYIPPAVVSPELCPMLSVAPGGSSPLLLSTESDYENHDVFLISWFEDFSDALTTANYPDTRAIAALQRATLIQSRLKTYGVAVPGLGNESEATVQKYRYGMTQAQGGIWVAETTLEVRTWQ